MAALFYKRKYLIFEDIQYVDTIQKNDVTFLPGTPEEKENPYPKSLMNSIYDMLTLEEILKFNERGQIKVAPLAYMRDRTLNQRLHYPGRIPEHYHFPDQDVSHPDRLSFQGGGYRRYYQEGPSPSSGVGPENYPEHPEGNPGNRFRYFDKKDVLRHPIIIKIIEAFESYEEKK